jgi:hypothetical protein
MLSWLMYVLLTLRASLSRLVENRGILDNLSEGQCRDPPAKRQVSRITRMKGSLTSEFGVLYLLDKLAHLCDALVPIIHLTRHCPHLTSSC